jgi:hypothetical protein
MATRALIVLVALALSACSSSHEITSSSAAPDMAKCRLVGAWELPTPSAEEQALGPNDFSWVEDCKRAGGWPSERFDADGTYHVDGIIYEGVPVDSIGRLSSTWRVVDEDTSCVTIEVAPLRNGRTVRRTIVFENDDRIRTNSNLVLVRRKVDLHAAQLVEDAERAADDRISHSLNRACQSSPCFSHINLASALDVLIRYETRWAKLRADAALVDDVRAGLEPLRAERRDAFAAVTGPAEADALLAVIQPDLGF